jgi:PIN domain nuclease of toxin-antitoxin system
MFSFGTWETIQGLITSTTMRLRLHHGDPFDRVLIAQAVVEEAAMLTEDAVFKNYTEIQIL